MKFFPYVIILTMAALIAVDIGGTNMRAAAYPSNEIKYFTHKKISTKNPQISAFDNLIELIRSVWAENLDIAAISVAIAGPVNSKTGIIYDAPNLPGWHDFPLGEKLREVFRVPVLIGNDANLAAIGEWKYGSGIDHSDLIYLTISTGVGGGIISNNILLEGNSGLAAELGHVTVLPDGPICSCGKKGHLEALSSGSAIANYFKQMLLTGEKSILNLDDGFSAYDISIAAKNGDELAISAYERAGFYLGQALSSFIHTFNPSIIILGGGVANSGSLIFDPIIKKINSEVIDPLYLKNLEIVPAKLSDDAGLVGALVVARQVLQT